MTDDAQTLRLDEFASQTGLTVRFIERALALGLSPDEIRRIGSDRSPDACRSVRDMLTRHIADIDQHRPELKELRATLSNYRHRCEVVLEQNLDVPCPTIADLQDSPA